MTGIHAHPSPGPDLLARLYGFASALLSAQDFEAAAALFRAELRFFGVDGYACGEVDLADPSRTVMLHAEWPADWLAFYLAEKLHESDPLMLQLRTARQAFTWNESWAGLGAQRWQRATLGFGWRGGLAVPLARVGAQVGLVSLAFKHEGLSGEENAVLATLAGVFYERARNLGAKRRTLVHPPLTPREIACLQHVAAGLDDTGVGMKLGIATSTAHEHVERAKRKLGARTRAQAVALAVGGGMMEPGGRARFGSRPAGPVSFLGS